MNKFVTALLALVALEGPIHGQSVPTSPRALHQIDPGTFAVDTDGKAREIVDDILQKILGVTSTSWDVWISEDNVDTSNAISRFYPPPLSKREIIFNRSFLVQITQHTGKWPAYCVAAHEIGHIIRLHLENANLNTPAKLKNAELEADYYCGFVLGKMNASYEDTVAAIHWYTPSANYPSRDERIAQIGRGWIEATGVDAASPVASVSVGKSYQDPTPQPASANQNRSLANFNRRDNRDIAGHDISIENYGTTGIPGLTLELCAQQCDTNSQCVAFSFDRWNSRCFLKNGIATSLLEPSSTIGVKAPASLPNASNVEPVLSRYNQKRFRDDPIAQVNTSNFDACRDTCKANLHCVAFSYLRRASTGQTNCEMFKRSDGYYSDASVDSGVKRQNP